MERDAFRVTLNAAQRDAQQTRESLALIPSRRANLDAQVLAERANERVAALNVARTEVRAPFSGRLQEVLVERDERVGPGTPLARLVDPSRIEVPLRVAVSAAAHVSPGDSATLRSTGNDHRVWRGAVVRIAPEADPNDRTITVFVEIGAADEANPDGPPKPGRFVVGDVESSSRVARIVLPRRAVRENDTVLVIDGSGRAAVRRVEPLRRIESTGELDDLLPGESQWVVVSAPSDGVGAALRAGEQVIVSGVTTLPPGTPVQAASADELLRAPLRAGRPTEDGGRIDGAGSADEDTGDAGASASERPPRTDAGGLL